MTNHAITDLQGKLENLGLTEAPRFRTEWAATFEREMPVTQPDPGAISGVRAVLNPEDASITVHHFEGRWLNAGSATFTGVSDPRSAARVLAYIESLLPA